MRKPVVAISMGDPNGIGLEVILKFLKQYDLSNSIPVLVGSANVLEYYSVTCDIHLPIRTFSKKDTLENGNIYLVNLHDDSNFEINPGEISNQAGKMAMTAVEKGIELCMDNQADALVTAPISKESINRAGYDIPGHTEFLAEKTNTEEVVMVLASENLRVALATIHIPLKDVSKSITKRIIQRNLRILQKSLKIDFGLYEPKIAVLGLNPHAGDGGVIGKEEIDIIRPAIDELSSEGLNIVGPYAADGYFGNGMHEHFDATFAMYHDQGLIPFKTLTFGEGVNFTAGLPIIRTSPDHGTAFDIAGKNIADMHSFQSAYQMAAMMAQNRTRKS
jgi:4-hydroxythreonine-4-phosphate dehydrogenase